MANHRQAEKRIRQTLKRTARNRHVRSTVRTYIKRVRSAVNEGNGEAARNALHQAAKHIDRAVAKGVYHRRTGSRYVSRLASQVAGLEK